MDLKKHENDFYNDQPQYIKDDIEQGLKDVEDGNVRSYEEVMKAVKEKYSLK